MIERYMKLQEIHTVQLPSCTTCYSAARTGCSFYPQRGLPDQNEDRDPRSGTTSVTKSIVSQMATETHSITLTVVKPDVSLMRKTKDLSGGGEFKTIAQRLPKTSQPKSSDTTDRLQKGVCLAHDAMYVRRNREHDQCSYEVFSIQKDRQVTNSGSSGTDGHHEDDSTLDPKAKASLPVSATADPKTDHYSIQSKSSSSHEKEDQTFLVIRKTLSPLHRNRQEQQQKNAGKIDEGNEQVLSNNYQPLPLHLTELCFEDGHAIALFVGCANEPFLRLYVENNLTQQFEEIIPDSEKRFLPDLSSPTMSLSTLHDDRAKTHYLAIGSQNGTISIVAFQPGKRFTPSGQLSFSTSVLFTERCFVDGPLVTLHFHLESSVLRDKYYIDLVVGSLRAFVCMYRKTMHATKNDVVDTEQERQEFEGPIVVTEGLFSERLKIEDSVLVVHKFNFGTRAGTVIAVGTYSGRLLLFEPDEHCLDSTETTASLEEGKDEIGEENPTSNCSSDLPVNPSLLRYKLIWSRNFNSPIHGIVVEDLDGDGFPELLITTLKNIHVF